MVDNHLLHKGNKILIVCQVKENRKVINQQQSISKKLFFLYIRDRETPKIDTKRIVPLFLMSSCYTFSSYCRSCYDHRIFAKSNSLLFSGKYGESNQTTFQDGSMQHLILNTFAISLYVYIPS